jgi:hypothetical protein
MLEILDKYNNFNVRLTKMKDNRFDNVHPNGINEGYVVDSGIIDIEESKLRGSVMVVHSGGTRIFGTSEVQSIKECEGYDLVYTLNSIYKLEPIITSIPGVQEKHSVKINENY